MEGAQKRARLSVCTFTPGVRGGEPGLAVAAVASHGVFALGVLGAVPPYEALVDVWSGQRLEIYSQRVMCPSWYCLHPESVPGFCTIQPPPAEEKPLGRQPYLHLPTTFAR